jgi:hypothetical protein
MRILQGFLIFMGALAVLAIIALIVGYVLALLTPDMRSNMRPVVLSAEAVDSFNKKLSDLKKEAAVTDTTKPSKNIQITITEEEVNSVIVMALAEGTLPAKEMLVNFNDGYLLVYNAWSFPAAPVKTAVIGTLDIENGKPKFIIRDFYLGKVPVPQGFDQGIQDLVNIMIKMNAPMEELRSDLKEVTISEGQLKMAGTTKVSK